MAGSTRMCHLRWQFRLTSNPLLWSAEGTEVDFVIYDDNDFVALEVKNAARLDSRDFAGLKAFQSDYPEARAVLLYRGETQYMRGNVLVVPVAKYLSNLVPGRQSPDVAWRR